MELLQERQLVCDAGKRLISTGLVAGTWGNISLRVDDQHMLITPSGQEYEKLTPKDIVLVNMATLEYEGHLKPSMERGLHAAVYQDRKDIHAVIHTHSINACVIASTRQTVPPVIDDMVQIIGPSLKTAEYAISGSKKLTKKVLKALKGRNAALLANHGGICLGRDMEEAFTTCQLVEKCCRIYIESQCIGGPVEINKLEAFAMHEYYMKIYSKKKRQLKDQAR
ncbi:class II aldolase/adducin family protein [Vallitalea okinawensis]|uniref:class II aldolase/adducin family protein n=1 Tax=Vallitalea okinawensis TaxID=2078660 RepID=UPI000CFCCE09|nr:class II aldolase/adducin family protein [Vallitalea okinawensis]